MGVDWGKPLLAKHTSGQIVTATVGQLRAGATGRNEHWIFVHHLGHPNRPSPEGVWFDVHGFSSMSIDWVLCYAVPEDEPAADPDVIEAREAVCRSHHDKHPDSPWHQNQARLVRSGVNDGMLDMLAAIEGIRAGRRMEREAAASEQASAK